jgi:hypothetical protein
VSGASLRPAGGQPRGIAVAHPIAEPAMRSNKRYTNTAFTHRPEPRDDPRTQEAPPEPIVCAGCGAVYVRKHWSHSLPARTRAAQAGQPIAVRICGACRRRQTGVPHGFVHVDGEFVRTHRPDIVNLLKNEAARAAEDNPLAQIVTWHEQGHRDDVLVTTTTEHLAVRLGRALEKAFDGRVLFGFSHENKSAHVWWHRDA